MKIGYKFVIPAIIVSFTMSLNLFGCRSGQAGMLDQMPEYVENLVKQNHEWFNEEKIEILGYSGDVMEVGISTDGKYLLFNDRNRPDKDMHWSTRIDDRTYKYQGKVKNTVSDKVDGTPSFDSNGNIYFTTLKNYPGSVRSIYMSGFRDGVAHNPVPVSGNIYVEHKNGPNSFWVSLDPDISDDGRLLFYSEGRFDPRAGFPYPFNVRGATKVNGKFIKIDDKILENINTSSLEYAPAISSDGLEIFFTRIGKVNGRPKMVGIYSARRKSTSEPFGLPEKIMAITGDVEAPVLSGDETRLYYHRLERGVFKVYRVTRKQHR